MKKTIRTGFLLAQAAVLALLLGCASRAVVPVPELDAALPAVAAQFRTQVVDHRGRSSSSEWRYWRGADRIVRENLLDRTSETWQRDGATLFHQKLYHAERRGIEFQQTDLQMLGALPSWGRESLIIDPVLLGRLSEQGSGWRDGHPYRRYRGSVDGARWDITLRVDLMLPVKVERRLSERTERLELEQAYILGQAPWQPTPTDGYGMLDFADLGDHERDPFVAGLQRQLGDVHAH